MVIYNKLKTMTDELKNTLELINMDLKSGTKVGGTRARKSLLALKKQCDTVRKSILTEQKNKKDLKKNNKTPETVPEQPEPEQSAPDPESEPEPVKKKRVVKKPVVS